MPCVNHPDVVEGIVHCARCGKEFCRDCVVELDGKPYDLICKEEQLRDLRSGQTGPDLAGAGRRFGGMFVDSLCFLPITIFLAWKYFGAGMFDNYVPRYLIPAALWIAYEGLMLSSGGQTLGKKAVGTKVVNADGSELQGNQAWLRAISRQVMGLTYILGLIDALMVFTGGRRTLHDRIGKTIVVNWKS